MEAQPGRLYVANLPNEFTETTMKEYFSKYGEVKDCVIIVDKVTRKPRGFGFVSFTHPSVAEQVMGEEHIILGRKVCFYLCFLNLYQHRCYDLRSTMTLHPQSMKKNLPFEEQTLLTHVPLCYHHAAATQQKPGKHHQSGILCHLNMQALVEFITSTAPLACSSSTIYSSKAHV